jgi:hypothetical protein
VTPAAQLSNAAHGWLELIRGQPHSEPRFRTDPSGLAVALGAWVAAVVFGTLIRGFVTPLPGIDLIVLLVVFGALPLAGVFAVTFATLRFLRPDVPPLTMLVPIAWGMALLLAVGSPLTLLTPSFNVPMVIALAFMLFRLARAVPVLPVLTSISYAILCVLALVTLTLSLYMGLAPVSAPT